MLIFRLQVQTGNTVYSGTYDAGRKIFHSEGFKGLYRGFFVSAFQVVSGVCYVSTYESVRHILDKQGIVTDNKIKAFAGKETSELLDSYSFSMPKRNWNWKAFF